MHTLIREIKRARFFDSTDTEKKERFKVDEIDLIEKLGELNSRKNPSLDFPL